MSAMIIGCRDECGASFTVEPGDAFPGDWRYLEASKAWRCPTCHRALAAMACAEGTGTPTVDTLPPDSRGALPKETASGIVPPKVPG